VGLDPNDFPALGSAPANVNSSSSNNGSGAGATSYATQAGTGVLLGGNGGGTMGTSTTGGQTRDFTPDDFPALGGQSQTTQQTRDPSNHNSTPDLSHPPGLNGFQPSEQQQQQLRQNLLGAQSGGLQQGTPGMLNLGPTQPRSIHPGFQQTPTDAEKQQRVCPFIS
jgi:CCR4-NOT transcription complex subunit 2